MWIDPEATLGGVPLRDVCLLLRPLRDVEWDTEQELIDRLGLDPRAGRTLARALKKEGYFAQHASNRFGKRWHLSDQGYRLATARLGRPYKRDTARRHLFEFLKRVLEVRDNPSWPRKVGSVALFGSMLDPTRKLVGDVDILIEVAPRSTDHRRQLELDRVYIAKELDRGRSFKTLVDEICSPQLDLYRFLKHRMPYISVHAMETEGRLLEQTASIVLYVDERIGDGATAVLSQDEFSSLQS
jgi:predicted nucleotidyltransferase